jgi:Arc/MetJ family transcription regulator
MRTTLNLDDDLVRDAMKYTGIREKTALIHAGLRELIQRAVAERLIALGGSDKRRRAKLPRRRRMG